MTTTITRQHFHPGLLGMGVFDSLFSDIPTHLQRSTSGYPVVDIYTGNEGDTILEFALAGFSKEDLSVDIQSDKRSITVTACMDNKSDDLNVRRIARRSFKKTYVNYDNNLDLTKSVAKFDNGLLSVIIPVRPETKSRPIKIQ